MNKKVEKEDFDNYLKEARTWETDKVREIEKSKKLAWRVATAASVTAFVAVLAVAGLTPLKMVAPYVIRVDNSTGIVDVVEALTDGKTNYDEAINKYFTQWYVRYREGYSKDLAEDYYYNVGIMSSSLEQQKYYQVFNPKNPMSPLNVYGHYAKVKTRIKSTSFINPNVALVRYTKEIERGLDNPQVTHWAATITFKYTKAPMAEKDRAINPLGFQVTEYRNDPDALTPDATPQTAAPTDVPATSAPGVTVSPAVPALKQ
ncbi:virB8 family protein [Verminephrobacter aporrectodeae]|uniref:virB8 family protein n=1 Tax=Verminephrobacter aporrectodeae TaxID=1110389 RepID=UPI0002378527|nr:virB8 family protein [Verminephrobacter aporrectodeae]